MNVERRQRRQPVFVAERLWHVALVVVVVVVVVV